MPTLKAIGVAVGSTVGIAIVIFVVVLIFRIKNQLNDIQTAKNTADVVRLTKELSDTKASLALRDSVALAANRVFLTSRANQAAHPIVTGGGKHADSVANAAINACYEVGADALTKCQKARLTADSVPMLQDTISILRSRLGVKPRWTASGSVFYALPGKSPLARVETQFRLFNLLNANVGVEHDFNKAMPDSLRTKYYIGGTIPFR